MTASCILFVLYGPVPVKRKVTIVPRNAPPDVFAAQPVIRPAQLMPAAATPIEQPIAVRPRGERPPALPRSRSARGTGPRDRHRSSEEDIRTQPTPRVDVDTGAFLVDGR